MHERMAAYGRHGGLGRRDAASQIVDRKKDIIISGGENISSIEVEKAIFAHPTRCSNARWWRRRMTKWGEIPVAIVVLKPDETLTPTELLAFLEVRLAKFKLPRLVEFQRRPVAQDGHRQDTEARVARGVLGGKN